jgi:hypothetical protein
MQAAREQAPGRPSLMLMWLAWLMWQVLAECPAGPEMRSRG